MALTAKKRLFADAVMAGKSNKDAAVAAGYSVKTASAAGSRLVKDKDIALYLAAARVERDSKSAEAKPSESHVKPADDLLTACTTFTDPKAFLLAAMNDGRTEPKLRVDAAKALMPFVHQKLGEGGKKDAKAEAAKAAASKFAALAAPKLIVNNRK